MSHSNQKSVAILATDGFEQSELLEPKRALEQAGFNVDVISLQTGKIIGWDKDNWGEQVSVDLTLDNAYASQYQALVLPGGLINPDTLRQDKAAIEFVRAFSEYGDKRPIAAICHGPWLLAEANIVEGKRLTSFASIQTDLKNAGAQWVDEQVVQDDNVITSRTPADLEAFNNALIQAMSA